MPEKKCPSAKQAERVKAQKGVHKLLKLFFYIFNSKRSCDDYFYPFAEYLNTRFCSKNLQTS